VNDLIHRTAFSREVAADSQRSTESNAVVKSISQIIVISSSPSASHITRIIALHGALSCMIFVKSGDLDF